MLEGRRILLAVTGGIAVYKAVELLRTLQKRGATVRVMMTRAAQEFVPPLTFQTLSEAPVATELFGLDESSRIHHIALARDCDCLVVAPATANFLAKLACGLADDLPSTVALACEAPLVVAPAMNVAMWRKPVTQDNVARLAARGAIVVPPGAGELACGETGAGRLAELDAIVEGVARALSPQDLAGTRLLVSSGPTWEPLDPVRFLGNRSTGRMGHAVARVAARRGAQVTLVSGPTHLPPPPGVALYAVETAAQMHEALLALAPQADALVMAAAVGDLRPPQQSLAKLRKGELLAAPLPLVPNPDILAELGALEQPGLRVGFAAETDATLDGAWAKLRAKRCQLLAYNRVGLPEQGFASETNRITLLADDGSSEELPFGSKEALAGLLLQRVAQRLRAGGPA